MPREKHEVLKIKANHGKLTLEELFSVPAEEGLDLGTSKLHKRLKVMGATAVQRRIAPSRPREHENSKVGRLQLEQIGRDRKALESDLEVIGLDEARFDLIRE